MKKRKQITIIINTDKENFNGVIFLIVVFFLTMLSYFRNSLNDPLSFM